MPFWSGAWFDGWGAWPLQRADQQAWQSARASRRSHVHSQLGATRFLSRVEGNSLVLLLRVLAVLPHEEFLLRG